MSPRFADSSLQLMAGAWTPSS